MSITTQQIIQDFSIIDDTFSASNLLFTGEYRKFDHTKKGDLAIWTVGKTWDFKGETYKIFWVGSFKTDKEHCYKSYDAQPESKAFNTKEKKIQAEIRETIVLDKQERQNECIKKWKPIFDSCPEINEPHDYLIGKGLNRNFTAKRRLIPEQNWDTLLIPIYSKDGFVGVQMVFWHDKKNKYVKYFSSGITKKGSYSYIGDIQNADHVYAAEGFATAASIHAATKKPVIVTLDCGNILAALETFRGENPDCRVTFCADIDSSNTGVTHAQEAAKILTGCNVAVPEFKDKNNAGSDFNDLHCIEGLESIRDQLTLTERGPIPEKVIPLGHTDNRVYYFMNKTDHVITKLNRNDFTTSGLYALATKGYWERQQQWNLGSKVDWELLKSDLMQSCRQTGRYVQSSLRGTGVWLDNDNIVVNYGDRVEKNGEPIDFLSSDRENEYKYCPSIRMGLDKTEPIAFKDMEKIRDNISLFRYENPVQFMALMGWIIQSQTLGAFDWRNQISLSGVPGSGKTTAARRVKDLCPTALFIKGGTEAGIRQELRNDGVAVIYDEAEKDKRGMKQVVEIAVDTASNVGQTVLKGTIDGVAQSFNVNTMFMFSAVKKYPYNEAAKSRIESIHLLHEPNPDVDRFPSLSRFGKPLLRRCIDRIRHFKKDIDFTTRELVKRKFSGRDSDKYACIFAGYHQWMSEEPITAADLDFYISQTKLEVENEERASDTEQCFNDIMAIEAFGGASVGLIVAVLRGHEDVYLEGYTGYLEECIPSKRSQSPKYSHLHSIIQNIGVKYDANNDIISIKADSPKINKELKNMGSDYNGDYANILRLSGINDPKARDRFLGVQTRCVAFQVKQLWKDSKQSWAPTPKLTQVTK